MESSAHKIQIRESDKFNWIDITDPDKNKLEELAEEFQLDLFQIRDSLEIGHLPKIERGLNYTFIILRAYTGKLEDEANSVNEISNKIAIFYNHKKIITIHRASFGFLETMTLKRPFPEDFVLSVIQCVLGTYESPLRLLEKKIEEAEEKLFLGNLKLLPLEDLYYQKAQARIIKKLLQITQYVLSELNVSSACSSALQDVKDRCLNLILLYEEILDDQANLLNTYLSLNAQRSNEVMKLLTIFSVFFLPLTFIAGIYGMNFDVMPELRWSFGYYLTLALMALVSIVIFIWFKRKGII